MFIDKGYYKTSKDYKKLFELLCLGHTIVCLVKDNYGIKQICKANRFKEFSVNFNTPGIGFLDINPSDKEYFGKSEIELFEFQCKLIDVEWIEIEKPQCKNCKDFFIPDEIKGFGKCQNKQFNDFILMPTRINGDFGCRFFNKGNEKL